MGRAIILIIVGMGILFSMSSQRMAMVGLSTADNATTDFSKNMARNIAKSGIELAIMQIDSNKYWRTGYNGLRIADGSLTLTASTIDSSNVRVRSIGTYNGTSVPIVATIYIPQRPSSLPDAFNYALMCDQSITCNGSFGVRVYNPGGGYNSDIHANASITMNGSGGVDGYATYTTGSFTANPGSKIASQFLVPPYPNGGPLYSKVTRKNIPWLNIDSLKTFATEVNLGNLTVSGTKTLGSSTDPAIIWVGGNLTFNGNVSGYGIFIVKGNVTFNGNVTCNYPPPASMENLAIYAREDVTLNGGVKVVAQILTNHSLTMNGNNYLVGSAICQQSITLNGTVDFKYFPANPVLTSKIWPNGVEKRPDLTSYWE